MSESEHQPQIRKYDPDGGRIDRIEQRFGQRLDQHDRRLDEHGSEISKLKQFQSFVFGAAAAIGALGGYLLKWLKEE